MLNTTGSVFYDSSDCSGCSGGISEANTGQTVETVRLLPFLLHRYGREFVDNICMVKIDTEGLDGVIMVDLPAWFQPRVLWAEWYFPWFSGPQVAGPDGACTASSAALFEVSHRLGYTVYQTRLPLALSQGCDSYQPNLLLMTATHAAEVVVTEPVEIVSMSPVHRGHF